MLHVYIRNDAEKAKHVAMIGKPPKCADAYVPEEPWCLLHNNGRVDRFESLKQAREEARKSYGIVEFKRAES